MFIFVKTTSWWGEFNSFSDNDTEIVKEIIESIELKVADSLKFKQSINDFLKRHYQIIINNSNSDIFKEKLACDLLKKKAKSSKN